VPDEVFGGEGNFIDCCAYAPIWDASSKKYPHLKDIASIQGDIRLAVPAVQPVTVEDVRKLVNDKRPAEDLEAAERYEEAEDTVGLSQEEYDGLPTFARSKYHSVNIAVKQITLTGLGNSGAARSEEIAEEGENVVVVIVEEAAAVVPQPPVSMLLPWQMELKARFHGNRYRAVVGGWRTSGVREVKTYV